MATSTDHHLVDRVQDQLLTRAHLFDDPASYCAGVQEMTEALVRLPELAAVDHDAGRVSRDAASG